MQVSVFNLKRAKTATLAIFFLCGIAISTWAPMVPYVRKQLSLNESEMGALLLFLGAGAIFMMPFSGWLISKIGSRLVIAISVTITAFSLPGLLLTDTVALTAIALFCFGAGLGGIDISVNAQGVQIQNLYGRPIMSSLHGLFSVGGLAGPLLVIVLLNLEFEPITVLLTAGALLIVIALTQLRFLMNFDREREITDRFSGTAEKEQGRRYSWVNSRVFFLGTMCFIVFLAEGAILDWSAIYLLDHKNISENIAGLGYASFSIAMASMRLIGDKIVSKINVNWVVVAGSFVTAIGFLIVIFTPWLLTVLIGFVMVGLGAANIIPVFFSEGGQLKGIPSASALAAITTMGYAGQLAGPALLGFVAEYSTMSVAFGLIAGLMALVGALNWKR